MIKSAAEGKEDKRNSQQLSHGSRSPEKWWGVEQGRALDGRACASCNMSVQNYPKSAVAWRAKTRVDPRRMEGHPVMMTGGWTALIGMRPTTQRRGQREELANTGNGNQEPGCGGEQNRDKANSNSPLRMRYDAAALSDCTEMGCWVGVSEDWDCRWRQDKDVTRQWPDVNGMRDRGIYY